MKLKIPQVFSQRDSRWASILLGYNTSSQFTIGLYGCLVASFANYINKQPDEVNQILKDNSGFVQGGGDFIWSKTSVLGLTQTYSSPRYDDAVTLQGITKIKELLDAGFPLICEIDFNPATTSEEMHYVLLIGYENDSIICVDPWVGQIISLDTYGGAKRAILQFRAYNKKLEIDNGVDLQAELDKVREERDRNWGWFSSLCEILGIGANFDLAKAELEKLVGIEDKLQAKEGQLQEANTKITDLEQKTKALEEQHIGLEDDNSKLNVLAKEQEETIREQGMELKTLSSELSDLKKDIQTTDGGWELIVKGIRKLFIK